MKKILSLALALMLCLGLSVSAFASGTLNGDQLAFGEWNNGPSLTLSGVAGMTKTPIDPTEIYDVEVGGSLVLEMTFPAGKGRTYRIWNDGFYLLFPPNPSDFADWENSDKLDEGWDPPGETGYFDESSGMTRYVYNFTEADMGRKNGYDKISYPYIYWYDDADGDGEADSGSEGSAYFGVRVVPAPKVQLSRQSVTLDGEAVAIQAYNIGGSNYFKLRDVAMMLTGTGSQFSVGYDAGAVTAKSGEPYTPIGGELTAGEDMSAKCVVSRQSVTVDGARPDASVYNIGGSNYFKLRDLGEALGFDVGYDAATGTVLVTTK